jgi:hypothetical protein
VDPDPAVFTKPFAICVAVSTSDDATGDYHLYEFPIGDYFPDYPKLGIWPAGFYMSIDLYTEQGFGGKFKGSKVCAFDRKAMLAGADKPAMVCRDVGLFPSLLPSDLDGATLPPLHSPNFFVNLGSDLKSLNLWKFQVDFAKQQLSTLTGPTNIHVANFTEACGGGICIPQAGTNRLLDSLGDRPMYRLAYRNFVGRDTHESLVVNHSVSVLTNAGSSVGVRWYEIRNPGSQPYVYQQSTFAPDATIRANFLWMGSVAMDKFGDIAVGYSESSRSIHPSIYFAGRVPADPLSMLEDEKSIVVGAGSQTNASNWGDYSSMSIDPVDDCTFWYTTEYLTANSNYNWRTRIASFKFSSCH